MHVVSGKEFTVSSRFQMQGEKELSQMSSTRQTHKPAFANGMQDVGLLFVFLTVVSLPINGTWCCQQAYSQQDAKQFARELQRNEPESNAGGDFVCGPRCVRFLLDYFSRPKETLTELVQDMQWPEIEAGSSLAEIESALNARKIYTTAMKLSSDAVLAWEHPVIVHLEKGVDDSLGHFVVWLPGSDERVCNVWNGVTGVQTGQWKQLRTKMSGYVLLTSPNAIAENALVVKRSTLFSLLLASSFFDHVLIAFPPIALTASYLLAQSRRI